MNPDNVRGLTIGVVTDVNDQERQGRVLVRFPWLDDTLESTWASMVSPFAGNDRGAFFMPDVGDEVIVGFLHADFRQAFVLGACWNGKSAAPSVDPRQRMIRSSNGHTIRFIDSTPDAGNRGGIVVEDAHGNRVTMTAGVMTVHAQTTLFIEGSAIVLRGKGWSRTVIPNSNPI
jgi:phage baseplate assembly protein V